MNNRKISLLLLFVFIWDFSVISQKYYFKREVISTKNILPHISANDPILEEWNRTWGGNKYDSCRALLIDSSDNVYLAGNTESFGAGENDMCLVKFDNSGIQLWNRTWGGNYSEYCYAIAIDSLKNIYLGGIMYNSSANDYNMCLVKFDNSGIQLWNSTWGGSQDDRAYGLVVDSSDNIYLVGETYSFGVGGSDMCIIKYNSSGVQLWNRTWGESDYEQCRAVTLDSLGNIYIAGRTDIDLGSNYSYDMYLVKYDSLGVQIWNRTWGGSEYDECSAIAVELSNSIYLAGNTESFGAGENDMCLVKYDSTGVQLWNRTWGGSDYDECRDIALDSENNIYLTGDTESRWEGFDDICLVKFDNSGELQWNHTWGERFNEDSYALTLDSAENIYLAGITISMSSGHNDLFLAKYDNSGEQQWIITWGGRFDDICRAMAFDSSENLYLIGYSESRLEGTWNIDMFLLKYSSIPQIIINSPSPYDSFGDTPPNFDVSFFIIGGNLNATWYTIDDGVTNITFSELTGYIIQSEWNKKGEGLVFIKFYANDTLGDKGYAELAVRKDTIAPTSSIFFTPHSGTNIVNKSTLFTLTADDGLGSGISQIRFKINDSESNVYYDPFTLYGFEFGYYFISYYAIDMAGNEEEIKKVLVKYVDVENGGNLEVNIPGYDLFFFLSLICLVSVILVKLLFKLNKKFD